MGDVMRGIGSVKGWLLHQEKIGGPRMDSMRFPSVYSIDFFGWKCDEFAPKTRYPLVN